MKASKLLNLKKCKHQTPTKKQRNSFIENVKIKIEIILKGFYKITERENWHTYIE